MNFEWRLTDDNLQCLVHQEAFVLDVVERYGLADCNNLSIQPHSRHTVGIKPQTI